LEHESTHISADKDKSAERRSAEIGVLFEVADLLFNRLKKKTKADHEWHESARMKNQKFKNSEPQSQRPQRPITIRD
jgi:hypothetical protein